MRLSELKEKIGNGSLGNSLLIFVWDGNNFLARQYLHEIAKMHGQEIQFVDSFEDILGMASNENVFGDDFGDNILKALSTDTLDAEPSESFKSIPNSVVVCSKIAKREKWKGLEDLIVEFPKPEEWQVKDYIKSRCQGLSNESVDRLYALSGGDINRVDNEMGKICCFPQGSQERLFKEMAASGTFSDIAQLTIFNLVNALIKRDMTTIGDALRGIKSMDVDAIGLASLLHRNIKNIIDIQMNPKATPESTGMSPKQFNAVRYSCGRIPNERLVELLMLIDSLDFKLKMGEFDIPESSKIDYIACNMLER